MEKVAFTIVFNWQFIIIALGIVLGVVAYIVLNGSQYDKVLKQIKKFKISLSLIIGIAIVFLTVIIAIILFATGVRKTFSKVDIYWYAIMIVAGMIAAIVFAYFMAKKKGLKSDIIIDLALVIIPLGIIGARLWFVIFEYEGSSHNFSSFWDILDIRDGGLGIYGGIIMGAVGIVIVSFWRKISVLKLLDIVAPCVLIAQAIGRWGNFFNQEAYGLAVNNPAMQWFPLSVFIERCSVGGCCGGNAHWHLATFFYEFLWNTIGFIGIYWYCYNRNKIDGIGVCSYFLWYGIGRTWIEFLRTDSLVLPGTAIRVSVLFSIIMIVAALAFGAFLIYHYKKTGKQLIPERVVKKEIQDKNGDDNI